MSVNSRPIVILALLIFVSGCVAQRQSGYVKVLQPISPEQLSHVDKIGVIVDPACVLKERLPKVAKGASEEVRLDLERIDHWVGTGAQMSDSVSQLVKRYRKAQAAAA